MTVTPVPLKSGVFFNVFFYDSSQGNVDEVVLFVSFSVSFFVDSVLFYQIPEVIRACRHMGWSLLSHQPVRASSSFSCSLNIYQRPRMWVTTRAGHNSIGRSIRIMCGARLRRARVGNDCIFGFAVCSLTSSLLRAFSSFQDAANGG